MILLVPKHDWITQNCPIDSLINSHFAIMVVSILALFPMKIHLLELAYLWLVSPCGIKGSFTSELNAPSHRLQRLQTFAHVFHPKSLPPHILHELLHILQLHLNASTREPFLICLNCKCPYHSDFSEPVFSYMLYDHYYNLPVKIRCLSFLLILKSL